MINENANAMMREASTLNKQVIIGVETDKNLESYRTSFYSKTIELMKKELRATHKKLS